MEAELSLRQLRVDISNKLNKIIDIIENKNLAVDDYVVTNSRYAPCRDKVRIANFISKARRSKNECFGGVCISNEPAFDILIDLYISESSNKLISVTSACFATTAPLSTALRWLKHLEKNNLVTRIEDVGDRRRIFVRLTGDGFSMVDGYLGAVESLLRSELYRKHSA